MAEKRCYTVDEICEILKISRPTAYDLFKKNYFRTIIVGRKYLVVKSSFDAWLELGMVDNRGTLIMNAY